MKNEYFFFLAIIIGLFYEYINRKSSNFSGLIKDELNKSNFKFIASKFPGLFKNGPFNRIENLVGSPEYNNKTRFYLKTYYRIVKFRDENLEEHEVWVKVKTNFFKKSYIEFRPSLDEYKILKS